MAFDPVVMVSNYCLFSNFICMFYFTGVSNIDECVQNVHPVILMDCLIYEYLCFVSQVDLKCIDYVSQNVISIHVNPYFHLHYCARNRQFTFQHNSVSSV